MTVVPFAIQAAHEALLVLSEICFTVRWIPYLGLPELVRDRGQETANYTRRRASVIGAIFTRV